LPKDQKAANIFKYLLKKHTSKCSGAVDTGEWQQVTCHLNKVKNKICGRAVISDKDSPTGTQKSG